MCGVNCICSNVGVVGCDIVMDGCVVLDVIDQTRGRVFHQDIQTPRSVLKNEAVGRVF